MLWLRPWMRVKCSSGTISVVDAVMAGEWNAAPSARRKSSARTCGMSAIPRQEKPGEHERSQRHEPIGRQHDGLAVPAIDQRADHRSQHDRRQQAQQRGGRQDGGRPALSP